MPVATPLCDKAKTEGHTRRSANNRHRLTVVDCMQGMACVLVVVGHHLLPVMPDWYGELHYYIYLFHMPLFIFLSGFLMGYAYKAGERTTAALIKDKIRKFLPGYIAVGLLCILFDLPQTGIAEVPGQLLTLVVSPNASESTYLWYIYLLMIYYPFYLCVIRNVSNRWLSVIIVLSLSLQSMNIPVHYFLIDYFFHFAPYLLVGVLAARLYGRIGIDMRLLALGGLSLFAALSLLHFKVGYHPVLEYSMSWVAIPAVYAVARLIARNGGRVEAVAVYVSKRCFGIYILHLFFVQALFLFLYQFTPRLATVPAAIYLLISSALSIYLSAVCWYDMMPRLKSKVKSVLDKQ